MVNEFANQFLLIQYPYPYIVEQGFSINNKKIWGFVSLTITQSWWGQMTKARFSDRDHNILFDSLLLGM